MKRALPYLAIAAPVAIFFLLHVLIVDPERRAASAARSKIAAYENEQRIEVVREPRASVQPAAMPVASDEDFGSISDAISALAKSPGVGGVSNLSVEMSSARTPISVSFDAQYSQIEAFLRNLDRLPVLVDLSAIQLAPAPAPNMRAKLVFRVFKRTSPPAPREPVLAAAPAPLDRDIPKRLPGPSSKAPAKAAPRNARIESSPEPAVKTILFSPTRRMALVDHRIVRIGDQVGPFVVHDIERDAVVFVNPRGARTRVALRRAN